MMHMAPLFSLAVLLCLAWMVLGQDDCLTTDGRRSWFTSNVDLRDCALPFRDISDSQDDPQLTDASKIQSVCTEECAGRFINFLMSTEECRESAEVQQTVARLENRLCAFYDSIDEPESSCYFSTVTGRVDATQTMATVTACSQWWFPGNNLCSESCTQALQTNIERIGCCYKPFFSDPDVVNRTTQAFIQALMERGIGSGAIPSDLEVDITDSDLFTACGITTPETCPFTLHAQRDVAVPLTTLLAAIVSVVASFY